MPRWVALAVLSFSLLTIGQAAFAGVPQPGDIGIFFDAAGTRTSIEVTAPFVEFEFYVIAFDAPGGIMAYELSVGIPAAAVTLSDPVLSNASASDFGAGRDNFIVGTGGVCLDSPVVVLVTYPAVTFLSIPGGDIEICLGPAQPSSGPPIGLPALPLYNDCNPYSDINAFRSAYRGCAVINPNVLTPPIPNALTSWGTVKSAYGN